MRILFIVGTCLSKNTSANMSHNSYIQGLLETGCDVDIIMKNDSWGQSDKTLGKFEGAKYIEYEANSCIDKIIHKFRDQRTTSTNIIQPTTQEFSGQQSLNGDKISLSIKKTIKKIIKKIVRACFPKDKRYPLDKVWLSNASSYVSAEEYDIVISNSSPAASHKLAKILIDNGNIKAKRWVQIWEDPWYHDLYGGHSEVIKEEEQYLLEAASEIYYVSPLTTEYQKKYFPTAAHKMKTIALPFFAIDETPDETQTGVVTYGYFGDYYSCTRNIYPFFNVLNSSNRRGFIYGDTDLTLSSPTIDISPRVTLDKLKIRQEQTNILVHLSNLHGGQIPGKIYHYSATTKPILFILDGTDDEKKIIKEYFGKFNRYYFCENTEENIAETLDLIERSLNQKKENPIIQFSPKEVAKSLLLG